jgi:hypothetical protein
MAKLGQPQIEAAAPAIDRVPRTGEEEALLLATRPAGWEYLLFASVLRRRRDCLRRSGVIMKSALSGGMDEHGPKSGRRLAKFSVLASPGDGAEC